MNGYWAQLLPRPGTRSGHSTIHDPVRNQIVIFGGFDGVTYRNDTWVILLPDSTRKELTLAVNPPPGRAFHSAIYDPVGDRMIIFGGRDVGSSFKDAWALSLGEYPKRWRQLPDAPMARGRYEHTAIYDPDRESMWVFGGNDGFFCNDTWALTLGAEPAWSSVTPGGSLPGTRRGHTAIYDPLQKRMVVFGGGGTARLNDTWGLSLGDTVAWAQMTPAGTPPSARYYHTAVYDAHENRMVVFGGDDGDPKYDAWALSLDASPEWSPVEPAGTLPPLPQRRAGHAAIYDPVQTKMIVFGGQDGSEYLNDTWALPLTGSPEWAELGGRPIERCGQTMIYDPVGDRMIMFGGCDNAAHYFNDTWELSLSGPPHWRKLDLADPPPVRHDHSAVYDPRGQRMVVFGGFNGVDYNDTWVLSLAEPEAWSPLTTYGDPPGPRLGHTAICCDVPGQDQSRMVVFGGCHAYTSPPELGDLWELSLGEPPTWTELNPTGGPPDARYQHTAVYDPIEERMIVYAGAWENGKFGDLWYLSLQDPPHWSEEPAPSGIPPSDRNCHTAIFDPGRNRMIVYNGHAAPFSADDVWWLWLGSNPLWERRQPPAWEVSPPWRYSHAAIYDPNPDRDRMVVFGGVGDNSRTYNDTWALTFSPPSDLPPDSPGRAASFTLQAPRPNPFTSTTSIQFALSADGPGRLSLYDATGRRIRSLKEGLLTPGTQTVTWDGRDDDRRPLPAGVFFFRLESPEGTVTRKVIRIR
jgi:hypothetical protein